MMVLCLFPYREGTLEQPTREPQNATAGSVAGKGIGRGDLGLPAGIGTLAIPGLAISYFCTAFLR